MTVKNNVFVLFSCVLVLCSGSAWGQEEVDRNLEVQLGDTFDVALPVNSSFHSWELADYDVRKLSLISREPPSNVGDYRFVFETLGPGEPELKFQRNLKTAISTEKLEERFVTVTIREQSEDANETSQSPPDEQPPNQDSPETTESPQTAESEEDQTVTPSGEAPPDATPESNNQDSPGDDESYWNRANELIETEYYDKARKIIQERVGESAGSARQRWKNLEAESYFDQGNYEEAIATWENMIEEFQKGPQAQWLLSVAEAHRENGAPDQSELALLEIRHHHQDAKQWPEAMTRLAQMAQEKDNPDRARRILQEARSQVDNDQHPEIIMRLAHIYDQFPSTRNYYKAVKLYQQAARAFDSSDTKSKEARERASYLKENFLNFGTQ